MRVTAKTKDDTRNRIVDAARKLFCGNGFSDTTTRQLAAKAEIATGTLFNYFPTKEALAMTLFAEALEQAEQDFAGLLPQPGSLDEALFAHISVGLRHLEPYRSCIGQVLEIAASPVASSAQFSGADQLRQRHLETVHTLTRFHRPAAADEPTAIQMHLYWTLFLGVVSFWSQDDSPHQAETWALLDQSMRLFAGSLNTEPRKTEDDNATEHAAAS